MSWQAAPIWLVLAATLLELRLSWPRAVPHPVRLIGLLLDRLEGPARRMGYPRLAGALSLTAALVLVGLIVHTLISVRHLGLVFALALAFAGLALGALLRAGSQALEALARDEATGDFTDSRRLIGLLVSRETSGMDAAELRRALAETLAENFNDAFVAPLFWLCLGGPMGLWLYKTVSTMDSMWGYTTAAWKDLGLAGARCDDLLAWIPARLSALLLLLAALGRPREGVWPGWRVIRQQAGRMASPNAGWPMAAAAWLHAARMGGPTPYFGTMLDKPPLGPPDAASWDQARLDALLRHIRRAGVLAALLAAATLALV